MIRSPRWDAERAEVTSSVPLVTNQTSVVGGILHTGPKSDDDGQDDQDASESGATIYYIRLCG
jgi:hypothetical protein